MYDQSDTEVDTEVFEEIVKESPGTLRIMLGNGGLGIHPDNSQISLFSLKAEMRTFIVLKHQLHFLVICFYILYQFHNEQVPLNHHQARVHLMTPSS